MNPDSIRALQAKINFHKELISEKHMNPSQTIELTINGHFEITKLDIQPQVAHETLQTELPKLVTKSIQSVSEKIHQVLMDMQAANG
jgi:hypothetical protein